MSFLYTKFESAIENAISTRAYGVHYSEVPEVGTEIHVHDCCEVILFLSGGNKVFVDGKLYDAKNGDLFILNQFEAHKIIASQDGMFAHFSILIHPDYVTKNSTEQTDLSRCLFERGATFSHRISLSDREIFELERRLLLFRRNLGYGDDIAKNATINQILVFVNRFFQKRSALEQVTVPENKPITRAVNYINEHFKEDLSLEQLAKHSFVSVNQLCKLFKTHFNTTAAKYITAKRIMEAKKMLLQKKSVAETALACGFLDYANFIRVFKKLVGVSPGKYGKS